MIQLTDHLWIGDSSDEANADLVKVGIGAVLNVAQDLQGTRGWGDQGAIEYMQVGLVDGPGNPPASYHAAVLALHALLSRSQVLVCCHTGGRAMAVALMYLHMTRGHGWDGNLTILHERLEITLPVPHEAHKAAFNKMNWRLLSSVLGD